MVTCSWNFTIFIIKLKPLRPPLIAFHHFFPKLFDHILLLLPPSLFLLVQPKSPLSFWKHYADAPFESMNLFLLLTSSVVITVKYSANIFFLNISRCRNRKSEKSRKEYERVTSGDLALPQVWMLPPRSQAGLCGTPVGVHTPILLIIFMLGQVVLTMADF